jgi:hypothetical protein
MTIAAPTVLDLPRDPSGIPVRLNEVPVLTGLAAAIRAETSDDAEPFLVGGWYHDATVRTCSGGIGRDPTPLLAGCETIVGGSAPWAMAFPGPQGKMAWDGKTLPDGRGPSIVRVHTHDARAANCRTDTRASCEKVMVVEDVLWTGDAVTMARPLTVPRAIERLESLTIIKQVQMEPNSYLALQRDLFVTPAPADCRTTWPTQTYQVHGDPRFGPFAIYPDEASRHAAQQAIDPSRPGCGDDAAVVRPGPAQLVGAENVLAIVYADEIADALSAALNGTYDPGGHLPFPSDDLDEAYRVVWDAEAARAAGNLQHETLTADHSSDKWYASYVADVYRRFAANALTFTIAPAVEPTEPQLGEDVWLRLQRYAVAGTARLFVVQHPDSTDPKLREERVVSFRLRDPGMDTWSLLVVG